MRKELKRKLCVLLNNLLQVAVKRDIFGRKKFIQYAIFSVQVDLNTQGEVAFSKGGIFYEGEKALMNLEMSSVRTVVNLQKFSKFAFSTSNLVLSKWFQIDKSVLCSVLTSLVDNLVIEEAIVSMEGDWGLELQTTYFEYPRKRVKFSLVLIHDISSKGVRVKIVKRRDNVDFFVWNLMDVLKSVIKIKRR